MLLVVLARMSYILSARVCARSSARLLCAFILVRESARARACVRARGSQPLCVCLRACVRACGSVGGVVGACASILVGGGEGGGGGCCCYASIMCVDAHLRECARVCERLCACVCVCAFAGMSLCAPRVRRVCSYIFIGICAFARECVGDVFELSRHGGDRRY